MGVFEDENPWRQGQSFVVDPYIPRKILQDILSWVESKEVVVLHGPRQAGKTTLLWKLVETLLKRGIAPSDIYYFNCDRQELRETAQAAESLVQFINAHGRGKKTWLFLDEAQRMKDPGLTVKILADLPQRPFKIFVSGSSSLELKAKTKESLAGRQIGFDVWPLSFQEYWSVRQPGVNAPQRKEEWPGFHEAMTNPLDDCLSQMLIYGGFPAVLQQLTAEKRQRSLRELYQAYVEKDIQNFLRIENVTAFNQLVKLLVFQHANLVNKSELAGSTGANQRTIEQYLRILQETFVIHALQPYFANRRKEIAHMPKIYFNDVGLANTIAQRFEPWEGRADRGAIMENFVFTELKKNTPEGAQWRFWRTQKGAEVDFLMVYGKRLIPIEVKSGALAGPALGRGFRSFLETYHCEQALVLNRNLMTKTRIAKTEVQFLPLSLFFLDAQKILESFL